MVRDFAPQDSDPRSCWDIRNGLLDEDGTIYKRGGATNKSSAAHGSTGLTFVADVYLDVGRRTFFANSADFGVLDNDDTTKINLGGDGLASPKSYTVIESMLFIGGGYIYGGSRKTASYTTSGGNTHLTNGSKTVTDASGGFTANVDAGMLLQRGTERVYVVASVDSDTQLTLRDAYEGTTTTTADPVLNNVYKITAGDPYKDADIYATCANRLLALIGNTLYFTPTPSRTTGKPQVSSFATTDYYTFPEGAQGLGIGVIGGTALIFTTAGVWTYDGLPFEVVDEAGNPQHRVQVLSRELRLVNHTGLAYFHQAIVAPCTDGIYLLDGATQPRRVSRPIDALWREHVGSYDRVPGQAMVYRSHLFLPVLDSTGVVWNDLLVARLDRPVDVGGLTSFPWTRFTGDGAQISAFAVRYPSSSDSPSLIAAQATSASRVLDCSGYFYPTATNKADAAGSSTTNFQFEVVTRDFETGNLTDNWVRALKTRAELVDASSDNPKIFFSYGYGFRTSSGDVYDLCYYDDLDGDSTDDAHYATESDDLYTALNCHMDESDGLDPHKCRVNQWARYIRFRLINSDPTLALRLRSLQVDIRPSRAVRK